MRTATKALGFLALSTVAFAVLALVRGPASEREPSVAFAAPPTGTPRPAQAPGPPGPALAGAPAVVLTGAAIRALAHRVLPLHLQDGGNELGWLTDVVYCGASGDSGASLRALLCVSPHCPAPVVEEHVLSLRSCSGVPPTPPGRLVADVHAQSASAGNIALSVTWGNAGRTRRLDLPTIAWSDIVIPIRGKDREADAILKPGIATFEDRYVNLYYRVPTPTLGPAPSTAPAIFGRSDGRLVEFEGLSAVAYLTIPVSALSEVIGQRAIARSIVGGNGIALLSRDFGAGLQVVTQLHGLSLTGNGSELTMAADIRSSLRAPGQQVLYDLPATARLRFRDDGRRLAFADMSIDDLGNYSCSGSLACTAANQVRKTVQKIYAGAVAEGKAGAADAKAHGREVSLLPPGRHWMVDMAYGTRSWSQDLEVLSNELQGGGSHLAFSLLLQ